MPRFGLYRAKLTIRSRSVPLVAILCAGDGNHSDWVVVVAERFTFYRSRTFVRCVGILGSNPTFRQWERYSLLSLLNVNTRGCIRRRADPS